MRNRTWNTPDATLSAPLQLIHQDRGNHLKQALLTFILATVHVLHAGVPAPESYFGHRMGDDRKLVGWEQVVSYFDELAQGSDKIQTEVLGASGQGRPFIAATIASPETLRNLKRYQQIQQSLADPRRISQFEAEKLITEGKTVILITCSIHSTEVASTLTAVEFAHRLITQDTPKIRAILDNNIVILVPSLNPDGVEIVRRWYEKTLGSEFEGTSPPELYHPYTGHDNNRDWYIFSQPETRIAISKLHNLWHPQITYDVHQQNPYASRMFIPPWMDPIDPNIDPVLVQLTNMIGIGMAADLTMAGKKGVVVNASYDFWSPARHYQAYHAGARILSESASALLASPIVVEPGRIRKTARGYNPREPSWNHPEPWLGGEWRLRDIIDYQLIAWESCLWQAAVRKEDLLRGFYQIGVRALERTSPFAFVIPAAQRDPGSAAKLLDTLAFGMVEIEKAAGPFEADRTPYPSGTFVIRLQQPYSSFAKTLLEHQHYPDLREYPGGPPRRPYDVTAHTLPLLMGVEVITIEHPFEAPLDPAGNFEFSLKGRRPAAGGFSASDINSWREVNRIWDSGNTVYRDKLTGDFYPDQMEDIETAACRRPRLGLYRSFVPSADEGWTRWLLEEFGFQFESITNPRITAGNLREKLDVLVFPDQPASTIVNGYRKNSMPSELTGGLNNRSTASLKAFVSEGGTLIFLNRSTEYAAKRLDIQARNVLEGVSNSEFYSPGSLLNVTLEDCPLSYGLPKEIAIWSQNSPAWEPDRPRRARALARFPRSEILASGWLLGEKRIAGQAALLEIPMGKGRVILFGLRPQYRAQSYQTFKLFFNALIALQ